MIITRKLRRVRELYREGGVRKAWSWTHYLLRASCRAIWFRIAYPFHRLRPPAPFTFRNVRYARFVHPYNATWLNERSVEIPIALAAVRTRAGKRILELGNVLSNYVPVRHDVLDKYDAAPGVIREDAADFRPQAPYDLIVSISTIEHIGFDERPQDPQKILRALKNLRTCCLAPGGTMLITFPLGYNSHLDEILARNELGFSELAFLKRNGNSWAETAWPDAQGAQYNHPHPFANVIAIGTN